MPSSIERPRSDWVVGAATKQMTAESANGTIYYTPIADGWKPGGSVLHILYGEDSFSLKEALAELQAECGASELGQANIAVLDGSSVTRNELQAACCALPFLAPQRLVVVRGLLGRFEPTEKRRGRRAQTPAAKEWELLAEHIADMPPSTVLVLVDGALSKANPMLKNLAPRSAVVEFVPPRGAQLQDWIRSRVAAKAAQISSEAARLLADLVGGNLWILSNEIEKLSLHAAGRRIEAQDVEELVSQAREANVFNMVDAVVQHRLGVASRLLHQLLDGGSAPPYLLYMITRQFRLLIQAKSLMVQRVPQKTIGQKIGVPSEFVLEKTLQQARGYTMGRLDETYRKVLDTDICIKTGAMSGEVALDLLITELCTSG